MDFVLGEVGFEVFEKGYFFLEVFWVVGEGVARHYVLFFGGGDSSPLIVVEHCVVLSNHYLSAVVEENASRIIRQ